MYKVDFASVDTKVRLRHQPWPLALASSGQRTVYDVHCIMYNVRLPLLIKT